MIKLVSYTYMLGINTSTLTTEEYCETKNLQSPYVTVINEPVVHNDTYTPVYTCNLSDKNVDNPTALLECVKSNKNWLKF